MNAYICTMPNTAIWITSAKDAREAKKKAEKKGLAPVSCRRFPKGDKYQCASDIPSSLLIKLSYTVHCHKCDKKIYKGEPYRLRHGRSYCPKCRKSYDD